jgi:ABC-2 type transport system permease protein
MAKKQNKTREIYDSSNRGHPAIEELKILFKYRDLILQLVRRDLVSRYKRSVLGIAWTMLNPLGTMIVMTVVFSRVFGRVESYPVYVLTGLIIWNFFSQTTRHCMDSTLWGSSMFGKIFLPRTAFIVSSISTGVVNLFISLIPLFIIMVVTKFPLHISAVILLVPVIFTAAFSLGMGLLLSAYSVFFPDIAEMYSILLTAWMYLTPVIVPETTLAEIFNGWLLKLNPMYYMVKIFRLAMYDGQFPTLSMLLIAAGISFGMLFLGWYVFTKKADRFAYYD